MRFKIQNSRLAASISVFIALVAVLVLVSLAPDTWHLTPSVDAQSATSHRFPVFGYILDSPTLTIAGATATTSSTSTTGATSAQIQWKFGTVSGSYGTCTVQAYTTYDGTNYLTLGSAVSVTVTSTTLNAWTLLAQAPTTSVTSSAVSSSAALGFGQATEYTLACSSYGTQAPVAISVIYK